MEVASVVASIISAFGKGRALYQRMLGKKRTSKARLATVSEIDGWLRESLDQRPREIARAYQQHVRRHGRRYAMGDSIAHSSLAHTLLTLNSGLIRVINRFLSRDAKTDELSRRALLALSEVAAADTLDALSQLSLRLKTGSARAAPVPAPAPALKASSRRRKEKIDERRGEEGRQKAGSPKPATVTSQRSRQPVLMMRGAWVRPKMTNKTPGAGKTASALKGHHHRHHHPRSKTEPMLGKKARGKHMEKYSLSEAPGSGEKQLPSTTVALPCFHREPNRRARPISSGTMLTAATKVGEIPDSRSSRQHSYDTRLVECLMSPPDGDERGERKMINRRMRFWKRDQRPVVEAP